MPNDAPIRQEGVLRLGLFDHWEELQWTIIIFPSKIAVGYTLKFQRHSFQDVAMLFFFGGKPGVKDQDDQVKTSEWATRTDYL